MRRSLLPLTAAALLLSACSAAPDGDSQVPSSRATSSTTPNATASETPGTGPESTAPTDLEITEHGTFDEGWALAFLPGTEQLLISERGGALKLRDQTTGEVREVSGAPEVHHEGQAGMHDVLPGPTFAQDGTVYLSWVRPAQGGPAGDAPGPFGVVGRARLDVETATLSELETLWEQTPQEGNGHFSLRLLIQDEHLFVTSGDRQKFTPAQETETNLGAVLRLTLDGEAAPDNPFVGQGERSAELWTIGHRNPLGLAADSTGGLWVSEMGPKGGDELNHLQAGDNYGWPEASMGEHYDGAAIPDHAPGDGFHAPAASWVPSISPGSLLIYRGELFPGWRDSALIGGLSGERIVRLTLDPAAGTATEVEEWDMGARIRALAEAPDCALWVLEDGDRGRLLELRPR